MSLFRAAWFKAAWFAAGWFGARGQEVQQPAASGAGFFVARRPSKRPYYGDDLDRQEGAEQLPAAAAKSALTSRPRSAPGALPGPLTGPLAPQMVFQIDLRGFVFDQDGNSSDDDFELIAAALAATL